MYLCTRKTESSAVGSALRSGRRGRAFESPLSDIRPGFNESGLFVLCRLQDNFFKTYLINI